MPPLRIASCRPATALACPERLELPACWFEAKHVRGINNLHRLSLTATGVYFQALRSGRVSAVSLHLCREWAHLWAYLDTLGSIAPVIRSSPCARERPTARIRNLRHLRRASAIGALHSGSSGSAQAANVCSRSTSGAGLKGRCGASQGGQSSLADPRVSNSLLRWASRSLSAMGCRLTGCRTDMAAVPSCPPF